MQISYSYGEILTRLRLISTRQHSCSSAIFFNNFTDRTFSIIIYCMSQKRYAKLIKCNFKLIILINNMQLFLDSTQCNLDFEPSFVGAHQVLSEI